MSTGDANGAVLDYGNMGPEELTLHYTKTDTTLIDSANLREWISAIASEAVLNKPRLATNANKLAKLLVSETGLGAETARDLAALSVDDLAQYMARADAIAIYGMLDSRALLEGDDCAHSGVTTSLDGSTGANSKSLGGAPSVEHEAYVASLKDIAKTTRDGMRSTARASRKKQLAELQYTRPTVSSLVKFGKEIYKKRGQSGDILAMHIKAIVDSPCQHTLDEIKDLSTSLGTEFEADDADLAEDITTVVRTEVIEALPEVTTSGLVLFHMIIDAAVDCQAICADQE